MVFPHGGDLPRHPSQLYEAFLEGLVLFVVLAILAYRPGMRARVGFLTGVFLVGYGLARTLVELFREPDAHLGFILGPITMGQLLSAPMVLLGLYLMVRAHRGSTRRCGNRGQVRSPLRRCPSPPGALPPRPK